MKPNLVDQITTTITKITKTFAFIYIEDSKNWFKGYFQFFNSEVSLHYINSGSSCLLTAVDNCTKHVHITFDIAKRQFLTSIVGLPHYFQI